MSKLFAAYRVLAILVGVLLAFCSLVALPLRRRGAAAVIAYSPRPDVATELDIVKRSIVDNLARRTLAAHTWGLPLLTVLKWLR